jgi:hypothetical protein
MDEAAIIKLFEPLYSDIKPETQFAHKKPFLAHYTTIQTIEKIISSKELWFSNPLYMNDLEEVSGDAERGEYKAHVRSTPDQVTRRHAMTVALDRRKQVAQARK